MSDRLRSEIHELRKLLDAAENVSGAEIRQIVAERISAVSKWMKEQYSRELLAAILQSPDDEEASIDEAVIPEIADRLAVAFRHARLRKNYSLHELAAEARVATVTVQLIERTSVGNGKETLYAVLRSGSIRRRKALDKAMPRLMDVLHMQKSDWQEFFDAVDRP